MATGGTDSEQALATLALGLLHYPGDSKWSARDAALLPGQLPDDLVLPFFLPPQIRMLGTLIRSRDRYSMLLESPWPTNQVMAHFEAELSPAGWHNLDAPDYQIFVPHATSASSHYCKGETGPSLYLMAYSENNEETRVRLDLDLDRRGTRCAFPEDGSGETWPKLRLVSPPGSLRQLGNFGGPQGASFYASLILETDLDMVSLAGHYDPQIKQAGWDRMNGVVADQLAWGHWVAQNESGIRWEALLVILESIVTEPPHWHVSVQLHRAT